MLVLLRQHPVIAIATVAVGILLAWGMWPQPVMVETAHAKRAPMSVTIDEEGRTRVIDRYVVSAPVAGVACRVQQEVGDPVEQGQVLLLITPLESEVLDPRSRALAKARVAAAAAALRASSEQARAAAADDEYAANELERLRPLMDRGLISREAFDRARTTASTAAAARRSADFAVEVARYELEAMRTALEYSAASPSGAPAERVPRPDSRQATTRAADSEDDSGPVRSAPPPAARSTGGGAPGWTRSGSTPAWTCYSIAGAASIRCAASCATSNRSDLPRYLHWASRNSVCW